jgi:hypothetical protein
MKTDLEGREYLCGLDLLGILYKKVVGSCEHGNVISRHTQW